MRAGRERKDGRGSAANSSPNGGQDTAGTPAVMKISPTEAAVIALFVRLARIMGLPRSNAEIYGMLFISPRLLALDDLIEIVGVSRGSAQPAAGTDFDVVIAEGGIGLAPRLRSRGRSHGHAHGILCGNTHHRGAEEQKPTTREEPI